MYILSKSSFLRGMQCHKSLFLNKNNSNYRDKITFGQETLFEQGAQVGLYARNLFKDGIEITIKENFNYDLALSRTSNLLKTDDIVLYEATFLFDEVISAADILVKEGENYSFYEVKSSTELKDTFILDAALQYYVIQKSGLNIKDFSVIYINNNYVKGDTLDAKQLFITKSILNEIIDLQKIIPQKIEELKSVLKTDVCPQIEIGLQCNNPYPCDFIGHCWSKLPKPSVFDISNLKSTKKNELYSNGIIELKDIPEDFPLNQNQWQQVYCELNGDVIIKKTEIGRFISELKYPLGYLDFESFQTAIPLFKYSKPYQQIVFQYSLHVKDSKNGVLRHSEFIAETTESDPRISFVKNLIKDCIDLEDILVYNINFEKTRLVELANDFPAFSVDITNIINRLKDLMVPFKERWYYSPEMNGSYSIKVVLPALVKGFNYDNLIVKDGITASSIFSSMIQGSFKGDIEQTKGALLEYCKLDTFAMVKILDALHKI